MIKVSVVILNWNGADMLRRFLPSVISCSQGEGIEVCVADNGSSDDSCRIVEGEFPSVVLQKDIIKHWNRLMLNMLCCLTAM